MDHDPLPGGRWHTTTAIKELMLARGLKPGDPMPTESELVETTGVSRSKLREAVRTLTALDILQVRHGTGTFVGQLSMRPLVEGMVFRGVLAPGDDTTMLTQVVEVRTGLDLGLAPRIVERLAGRDDPELRACVRAMADAAGRGESFSSEDRTFHLTLAERLGNDLYGEIVAAFWDIHMTVAPRLGLAGPRDLTDTALAHERMLDAAIAGDIDAYRAAVVDHYTPILRMLGQHGPSPRDP
ncbi:FadR/GntR family transcriptional regulator [Propioniciclava soli]|uniref:FadR/GntR family transcriptional regulator n=1 Tax=Propioniciclava soli TaxID=2775081 RepID=UPI001E2AD5EE|nr:FCD domain-containing protein [Propioniciclava soli]